MFRHPKYYKELRKRNTEAVAKSGKSHASLESDQVISGASATASVQRASGPGLKQQAASNKLREIQASSVKHQATEDASNKLQAPSDKHQASSRKRQAAQ